MCQALFEMFYKLIDVIITYLPGINTIIFPHCAEEESGKLGH